MAINNVMNIVWATNENYVFITGVSMVSVFENNRESNIRVWILTEKVSDKSKAHLMECAKQYGKEICFIDTENYLQDIKSTGARHWGNSFSAYSRLFIADMMEKEDVERVLYCDGDLIIDGSLEEIWRYDLKNKPMGMVKAYDRIEIRDLFGLPYDTGYYNSGFLMIDINEWRKRECTKRILLHMQKVCSVYPYVDQDLINCVLHDEICTLPIEYNVSPYAMQYSYRELTYVYGLNDKSYYTEEEFNTGLRNGSVKVYHCTHGARPWHEGNHHAFAQKWDYYYERSIWHELYKKRPYQPTRLSIIQEWLSLHLPRKLWMKIHRYFAIKNMKNLVKKDISLKKSTDATSLE